MNQTDTYNITPDKSLVKKLGMAGYRTSQALAELVDNSIDARIPDECQRIVVRLDFKGTQIIVEDNGSGMDGRELADAMTIAKETKTGSEKLGRFGIGMKSACSALGRRFEIATSKGDGVEYHTQYDEKKWLSDKHQGWKNLMIIKKTIPPGSNPCTGAGWRGTKITISNLSVPLYPNQVSNLKENFGIRYSPYLESGQINLSINKVRCSPVMQDVVPESTVKLQIPLDFGNVITGHLALLKKRSISGSYGIHLFWRGGLIRAFAKVGFRAHPENAKIVGSINLDHVPVNYTKSGFLEESTEYNEAIRKLAASEPMNAMLRKSEAVTGSDAPSLRSIFNHVIKKMDDGYNLSTRMRAELSMNIIASTRPFTLSENGKKMHVCVERKEPSAPLYVTDVTGKKEGVPAVHILINTNSDAFKFAKNPLFLIAMIASESKIIASHPEAATMLTERNREMTKLLSRQKNTGSRISVSGMERWRRGYSFIKSGSYGLNSELIEAHDILVDRHEFRFQFTALSTLSSYMHDLGGKLVYTVHTIPPHGEEIVELLAKDMEDGFAVVNKPSAATVDTLLQMPNVQRVLAVGERAQITGSTIAEPARAFVDLMSESSARRVNIMDQTGLRRILEGMMRLDAVSLEDVRRHARVHKRTAQLDALLAEVLQI